MRAIILFICLGLNVMAAGSPQTSDVEAWIERMKANLDQAYYTKISGSLQLVQEGQEVRIELSGRLTYKDPQHARLKMTMKTRFGNQPATMDLLVVSDGTHVWQEIRSSLMQGAMVEKAPLNRGEMASEWMDLTDWGRQVAEIKELENLRVVSQAQGQVVLEGLLDEASIAELGYGNAPEAAKANMIFRIVLDEQTVFPISVMRGPADQPLLNLQFSDYRILDKAAIPPGAFGYQPPDDQISPNP